MAHYGLLRDYRFEDLNSEDDIRGSNVYGRNDEKLGKLDDVIFEHDTAAIRYIVVDAGGWFSHKKFLVPVHRLHTSPSHPNDFAINLDKSQIETLPRYNESDLESEEKWTRYEKPFDEAWQAGPVQHRKQSDHNLTPTADEMPEEPGSMGSLLSASEQAELSSRIIPAGTNEVTIQNSGMGIGSRWLTFEDRLRQRRRDITRACINCTVGPASDRASESATQERKAV